MTNFEKYKDKIMKIATESNDRPAKKNGVVVACGDLSCKECDFSSTGKCTENLYTWLCEDDGEDRNCCDGCIHEDEGIDKYPCSRCCNNYINKFERKKTRQDEFLERYPNAKKRKDILTICPNSIDVDYNVCETYSECPDCRRDYWLKEVEE